MKTEEVQFKKTGIVYSSPIPFSHSEQTVLLFHGYAQRGDEFLAYFEELTSKFQVIAPEGGSLFYKKGLKNDVGASWMTSYHRKIEIENYLSYLDSVSLKYNFVEKPLVVIAFSQGVSTCLRWLQHSGQKIHKLILIAGVFPEDVIFETLNIEETYYFRGDSDGLISQDSVDQWQELYEISFIKFEGKHEINQNLISHINRILS